MSLSGARIAQTVGITGAAFISGAICSLSVITVPALLSSSRALLSSPYAIPPSALATQWAHAYNIGAATVPATAAAISIAFFSLAAAAPGALLAPGPKREWAAAGLTLLGIVPYTLLIMKSTNDRLHRMADQTTLSHTKVEEDMTRWAWLNVGRSLFPLLAALLGARLAL